MELQNCKVGTRVAFIDKWQPCNKGVVKSKVEPYMNHGLMVIVEWDNGLLEKVNLSSLITEAEGIAQDARIREEQDRLEADWAQVESLVTEKLNAAAALINEANALASKAGKELHEMWDSTSHLMDAMDDAGWRTSSMSC